MTEQIGTLAELDVKPGDVVEQLDGMSYDGQKQYFVCNGPDPYGTPGPWLCRSKDGDTFKGWSSSKKNCRLISRATPPVDLTKLTAPFGLLDEVYGPGTAEALVAHGGPYERYGFNGWRKTKPAWVVDSVYHVTPALKRETVTKDATVLSSGSIVIGPTATGNCTITYDTLDGVIDMATYRVVPK